MRVTLLCRLRTAADRRPAGARTLEATRGNDVMYKVMLSVAFAVALVAAPVPHFIPAATAQQPASAPDKNAKTKKEPSAGQLAARERQKKCAAEWKEAKASGGCISRTH